MSIVPEVYPAYWVCRLEYVLTNHDEAIAAGSAEDMAAIINSRSQQLAYADDRYRLLKWYEYQ